MDIKTIILPHEIYDAHAIEYISELISEYFTDNGMDVSSFAYSIEVDYHTNLED